METKHTSLTQFLAVLKAELATLPLTAEDRAAVQRDVTTIEAQMAASRPTHASITGPVHEIKDILSVLAISDVASVELIERMHRLPV